jgi:hypothetical protein
MRFGENRASCKKVVETISSRLSIQQIRNELKKDNDKFAFSFNFIADRFFRGDANPRA